jgi:hypothetical protein
MEEDWRNRGKEIFPILRAKYPQGYFQGIVSLARIIRWEVDPTGAFDRRLSPEEIMNKLEERVGPEGHKLFEQFLRKVNAGAAAIGGAGTDRSTEPSNCSPLKQRIMSLARIIRWDVDPTCAFDRPLSPEEIMDELEKRVGREGRKLFQRFLRQVNRLQARQQLEARAQTGESGGG